MWLGWGLGARQAGRPGTAQEVEPLRLRARLLASRLLQPPAGLDAHRACGIPVGKKVVPGNSVSANGLGKAFPVGGWKQVGGGTAVLGGRRHWNGPTSLVCQLQPRPRPPVT